MDKVKKLDLNGTIKAIIVPHAGYSYSGQVAAVSFRQLDNAYKTVFVLGPSHRYPLEGVSTLNVTHFKTPLGEVKLSKTTFDLLKEPLIKNVPEAHANEHSIEIELPFLQEQLPNFELVPILVGNSDPEKFKDVLLKYLSDKDLIVISADLSHYHPYDDAKKLDAFTIESILNLDSSSIFKAEIDAPWAVATLLEIAKEKNWKPMLLYYANSGDVTGDKTSVVGYSAIIFVDEKMPKEILTPNEQELLLKLARDSAEQYLKTGKMPKVDESKLTPALKKVQGCFTTFNKNNNLRGCIGHILPQEELYKCVMDNAVNAAVNDIRFNPVKYDEMKDINIEISVLTLPQKLAFFSGIDLMNKLRPMVDGVVLKQGWHQSTYLPQVWEDFAKKEDFLSSLCQKGGMDVNCWNNLNTEVSTYQAFVFKEH